MTTSLAAIDDVVHRIARDRIGAVTAEPDLTSAVAGVRAELEAGGFLEAPPPDDGPALELAADLTWTCARRVPELDVADGLLLLPLLPAVHDTARRLVYAPVRARSTDEDRLELRGLLPSEVSVIETMLFVPTDEGGFAVMPAPASPDTTGGHEWRAAPQARVLSPPDAAAVLTRSCLCAAVKISGALEAVLGLTAGYANAREQFGQRISRFQTVKQSLALLSSSTRLAHAATHGALRAVARDPLSHDRCTELAALAAFVQAARAGVEGLRIAHQIHGAIGFTSEYPLYRYTHATYRWLADCVPQETASRRIGEAIARLASSELLPLAIATTC